MTNKNNRIIIKAGHACVCLGTVVSRTSHQLRVYSTVDDLQQEEEDDARQREKKEEEEERDDMYGWL